MMSQTPLDVSGKLHAEPAELDEEEESSDEEPTPKKQKSTRSSKKVSPFLFFWISVGCYHQMMTSLSLAAG